MEGLFDALRPSVRESDTRDSTEYGLPREGDQLSAIWCEASDDIRCIQVSALTSSRFLACEVAS